MKVGLFTIVKDEHQYLEEWLQYHLNKTLGIDCIYVFDDPFSKSHSNICSKFSEKIISKSMLSLYSKSWQNKILNRIDYKETTIPRQIRYMDSVLEYLKNKKEFDWVFYLDVDEFLTLSDNSVSIPDIIKDYNDYDVLVVSWKNFGASGHLTKPEGSTIENYTVECSPNLNKMSYLASSKLCFNLHRWDPVRVHTNHHIPFKAKWCKPNYSQDLKDLVYDRLYIRHYITKSLDEFLHKLFLRGQFFGSKDFNSFFVFNPDINKKDPEVRKVINKYRDMFYSGEIKFSIF